MSQLLVCILDLNITNWQSDLENENGLRGIHQFLIYLHAFMASHDENKICVIGCRGKAAEFLFPRTDPNRTPSTLNSAYHHSPFFALDSQIIDGVCHLIETQRGETSTIPAALSMGLCYIRRQINEVGAAEITPRLVVISVSDDSSQYIQMMNAIFSAQKSAIPIDVIHIGPTHFTSTFLQQAAHITGGLHIPVKNVEQLLQALLTNCLIGANERTGKGIAAQNVDFRAACFCHKKIIDIGYICSVCLSVFCQKYQECSTCGYDTTYDFTCAFDSYRRTTYDECSVDSN